MPDALTGLLTHAEMLGLESASTRGKVRGAVFLDLVQLARLNYALGFDRVDAVLVALAERLQTCADEDTSVARVGGDEFALVTRGHRDEGSALTATDVLADRVHDRVEGTPTPVQPAVITDPWVLTLTSISAPDTQGRWTISANGLPVGALDARAGTTDPVTVDQVRLTGSIGAATATSLEEARQNARDACDFARTAGSQRFARWGSPSETDLRMSRFAANITKSGSEVLARAEVRAVSLAAAKTKLEDRFGQGTVFDLHKPDDL